MRDSSGANPIWLVCLNGNNGSGCTTLQAATGHTTQAHWVGYDGESTHAHCIYWQNTNTISVECNIKFVNTFMDITTQPDEAEELLAPPVAPQQPAPQQVPPMMPQTNITAISTTLITMHTKTVATRATNYTR